MKSSLFNSTDLESVIKVTGYHFEAPLLLEGVDDITIAHGIRYRTCCYIFGIRQKIKQFFLCG